MRFSDIYLAGIGTAATDCLPTAEAVARGWYSAEDRERGGLVSISVAGATPAPDLAIQAARNALAHSDHAPGDIGAVLHTSVQPQGPDGWSPQHYINRKTVNQPVTSIEIRNGCVGFFSNLQIAACYLNMTPCYQAVMITSADNFGTPAVNRWRAAPKLFVLADGGASVVVSKRSGFARLLAVGSVSNPELEERHRAGEEMFPPGPTPGGTLNFAERIDYWQRSGTPEVLAQMSDFGELVISAVELTLKEADSCLDEIVKVVHDGYTRDALHDMFLDPLGIEDERSIWDYTRHVGHAGPLDQIRGLEHVWRSGAVDVGDKVLLVSDAPGMEAACAVFEILEHPPPETVETPG